MSRPHSASQGPKKYYIGREQYKNLVHPPSLPSVQYKPQSNYAVHEDSFNEEFGLLQMTWDELGITQEYRNAFINMAKRVSESERKDIFQQEKINLKKFRDALLTLKKEISNRENNLTLLKQFDQKIENCINAENNSNSIDNILQDVISVIKTLRLNAINIVTKIIKVNQISAYYSNSGKFDTSKMKSEYSYDPKYLFKMKEDLLFLRNSALSTFIEMNNSEIDAFLTNCAPSQNKIFNNNNTKIKIPISDDLMKLITECRYSLLQETVLASVDRDEIASLNYKKNDYYEENLKRGNSSNKYRNMEDYQNRFYQRPFIMKNNSTKKKKNTIFQNNRSQNMSKYIYDLKNINGPSRYNNLFYKNSSTGGNARLMSGKKRIFHNINQNNNNLFCKRIPIEHEVIQSLTNEQFLKKLGNYKNSDDNHSKLNNEISDEIENLKNDNRNFELQVIELTQKIENLEKKAKEDEEQRENLQNKYKELSQRAKQYQTDLEKNTKLKKKKEYELNNKIEQLKKEKEENRDKDKEQFENEKKEMKKKEDELTEKIKNLENKLKNEENEKNEEKKKQEELNEKIKNLENKLKNEENEKNEMKKKEEELQEKISNLENQVRNEEYERKQKESENENLVKQLKEEKEGREKEKKIREEEDKKRKEQDELKRGEDQKKKEEDEEFKKNADEAKKKIEEEKNRLEEELKKKRRDYKTKRRRKSKNSFRKINSRR
jgi:hypothetical protein